MLEGSLENFQAGIGKYLRGLNEFRRIPILTYKQSDIDSVVRSSANSSIGIAIIIFPPYPEDLIPNVPGPIFRKIVLKLQVLENLATNRSGNSAIFIAEKVMQYLHLWRPQMDDWNDELMLSTDSPWKVAQENDTNVITLQFETHCSLKPVC